jgi:hypothetical protein
VGDESGTGLGKIAGSFKKKHCNNNDIGDNKDLTPSRKQAQEP